MRRLLITASALAASVFSVSLAVVPLPVHTRPNAFLVEAKDGSPLRAFTSEDGGYWRFGSKHTVLPEHLRAAVLTFEDQRFYAHPGVDPIALLRAATQNIIAGRVVSGGSTLTMQVARMIDPRPRTFSTKLLETFRAVQLELRFDKEEIFRNYLDLAPYGGNIEGISAAARFYFDKDISLLTLDEAATLAALPNAPGRLAASPTALRARRDEVLRRMVGSGTITEEQSEQAISVPLNLVRKKTPQLAPHLAEKLRSTLGGTTSVVRSSIDPVLQKRAEDLLAQQHRLLMRNQITNGAVVIIENKTRKIRALAGSPNFFDAAISGQVDGTAALRSPGSTLKPFVYALAFDRGLAGVSTALEDVPLIFKDWAPENFDGNYRGLISAEDALRASLNIPAVELSRALGSDGLISFLHRAGFVSFEKDAARHGLSVVLGGCDVTLLELTNLYATLASGGKHRPPSMLENDSAPAEIQLFSEGAAYLTTEILSGVRRPELPDSWKDAATIPRVAWKTGTSYGRRDAWTIGYDRQYTVGVWVGHFDGRGIPELIGVHAAAPLFFGIFETLGGGAWFEQPSTVRVREVCALSGAPANSFCAHKKTELALENAPPARCAMHEQLEVDDATGKRLCSKCRAGRARHYETHVSWPPRTTAFFASTGAKEDPIPAHDPRCTAKSGRGSGPIIAFPLADDEFLLRDGVPPELQKIVFRSAAEGGSGKLYWFVDGVLFTSAPAGVAVEWTPLLGPHRIALVDEDGASAAIEIRVRHSVMLLSP